MDCSGCVLGSDFVRGIDERFCCSPASSVYVWILYSPPESPLALIVSSAVGLHVLGFTAIFIALFAVAPKNDATFVWATFLNTTGWPNNGVAWLLGMLTSCYAMIGYDLAAHLRLSTYVFGYWT
jgi:hypothetical protein